ncbi:MAG: DEAD/DEAH box helicase [Armatimonadota bacterium]|nr:DEAD/DEAH box helicase [Armatimonadota bacterium]
MLFSEMELHEAIQKNLALAQHVNLTEIQELALPAAIAGRDLIACANTGGGKTAVYALPILNALEHSNQVAPRALVLVPTRELAIQVEAAFGQYGKGTGLRGVVIYGGASMGPQVMRLRRGVDLIVATPGRLFDHLEQGTVDLSQIKVLILDEADRLLDMGFQPQVERIVKHIPAEGRQTMLFSATMDVAVEKLASRYLSDPEVVNAQPRSTVVPQIEQIVHRVSNHEKGDLLLSLLTEAREANGTALVFTRTRMGADRLDETLAGAGVRSGCIHGEVSQRERERVLSRFRNGGLDVLVATDVAARGIDVPHITHVINYDMPVCAEDYIHRIGRTGRAGRSGKALTFVTHGDTPQLRAIEKLVGKRLDPNPPSEDRRPSGGGGGRGPQRHVRNGGPRSFSGGGGRWR